MIVLTDSQVIVMHRLLTAVLLNESYQLADVEDALVWLSPENRQILCPFDLKKAAHTPQLAAIG